MRRRQRRAIVQNHRDIATYRRLDFHHEFGRVEMPAPIDMRLKMNPIGIEFAHLRKAKDLKPARIGQISPIPRGKLVQASCLAEQIDPRAQIEMVGICQDNRRIERFDLFDAQRLYRTIRPNGHKYGRLNDAMGRFKRGTARRAFGFYHGKHIFLPAS